MNPRKEVKIDKTAEILIKKYSDPEKDITSSKRAFEIFNIMLNNAYKALSLAHVEYKNRVGPPIGRSYTVEKDLYYVYNEKKGLFASKVIPINIMKASTLAEVVGPLRKFKLGKKDVKKFNESFIRNLEKTHKSDKLFKYPAVVFFRAYLRAISLLTYSGSSIVVEGANNLLFNRVKFTPQELNKLIINSEIELEKEVNIQKYSLPLNYDLTGKRFELDLYSVYGLDPYNMTDLEYIIRRIKLQSTLSFYVGSDYKNSMRDDLARFREHLEFFTATQSLSIKGSFLKGKDLPFKTYAKFSYRKVNFTLYPRTGLAIRALLKPDNIDVYFDV